MKNMSRSGGFSLIELLTVIAIIAILAAIIFPVMGMVKERARQNHCMANLKQIAIAVGLFKTDNRKYPEVLAARAYDTAGNVWDGGTDPDIFANAKDQYLYPEYVKTIQGFHCPSSKFSRDRDLAIYDRVQGNDDTKVAVYAYDSYDCFIPPGIPAGGGVNISYYESGVQPHYRTQWAPDPGSVGALQPYPTNQTDTDRLKQADYERQLKWRNPPGDTVVTWCYYHTNPVGGKITGNAIVVYLDGSCELVDGATVEACKWRMRPKL